MPEHDVIVAVKGLDVRYGRSLILHEVDLELARGESLGLIGETGSGKSTLARAIVGLVTPSSGQITVGGTVVSNFSAKEWRSFRRRGILQYMFQDPLRSLDPDLTIRQSLAEPLLLRGGTDKTQINSLIADQLQQVHLPPELLDRYPSEVSGGQRQRVLVARALVMDPEVLILDEPVSALDSANRAQVLEILNELREARRSMLFISHDLGSVARVTDRVAVLYRGEVVEVGPTVDVISAPQHPYTRLLVRSAPTLGGRGINREERQALRALVDR